MSTRKLFQTSKSSNLNSEQRLHEDLIIEAIQIYGHDCVYLPKETTNLDTFFGEDAGTTTYKDAYEIEMYVKNVESFEGEGSFMQQFGLEIRDQTTFTIARKRFDELETNLNQPKEGDLIWFPLLNAMFKIQFVDVESIFYQLGHLPVYDLQCELFDFQNEIFETPIEEINEFGRRLAEYSEYDLVPGGSGTFKIGETVFQGTQQNSSFTAKVSEFDLVNTNITLISATGIPQDGVTLIGEESGAEWTIDLGVIDITQLEMERSGGDNWIIEEKASTFIDFTENNPFGDI
jgi:hypothetical protein